MNQAPQAADLETIRDYTAGISSKWLTCRARQHSMQDHSVHLLDNDEGYIITLRCSRCGTKKTQTLDSRGHIVDSSYDYPEGYQLPKGSGRIDSDGRGLFRVSVALNKLHAQTIREESRRKSA